jgi:VIT1/CCC1 family predicted Fe2+/Mn2+ transporter/rubrerythrin
MRPPTALPAAGLGRAALLEHWRDEADAAYVYAALAPSMRDAAERQALEQIAREEGRHRDYFAERLRAAAPPSAADARMLAAAAPSLGARGFVVLARLLGPRLVLGLLRVAEGREVARFLREVHEAPPGAEPDATFAAIARETAEHAQRLGHLTGVRGDPWHRAEAGSVVRNVVYGFNDGLTANFGLIAGVIGASVSRDVILLTGLSGLVASAFSMAASGYLAATSQREVDANEINVQRAELVLWPDREEHYLATLYQEKGLSADEAAVAAHRVMSDPEIALRELAREKLGIAGPGESALREGTVTGLATTVGALVPLLPFFFGGGRVAAFVSFAISMGAHFLVGAARSALTGRQWFRSGFDMFAVGLGVAGAGYLVGYLLTGVLPGG